MDFNNLSPLDILSKKTNKMSKRLDSDVLPSNASITSIESTETMGGVTDQYGYNQYGEWNPRRTSSASSIVSRDSQDFSYNHRQTSIISTNSSIGGLLMSLKVDEEEEDEDEDEYDDEPLAQTYTNDTASIHSADTVQQRELTLEEHRSEFENYYRDHKPRIIDDDDDDDLDEDLVKQPQVPPRFASPVDKPLPPAAHDKPLPSSPAAKRVQQHTRVPSNSSARSLTPSTHTLGNSSAPTPTVGNTSTTTIPLPSNSATADEHLSAGITFHEHGKLRESAYQFQTAANMGEPTAMLLYGLALRHGWGLRQNPEEAVKWLKRATNIFFDAGNDKGNRSSTADLLKTLGKADTVTGGSGTSNVKKSRVGLALYELGMSYLHSWGAGKDEDSALQYFELAGTLGDGDALCEAANIWMKNGGNGRKKNLHRAAELYRQAEDRGVVIVGNHWIYKDKYMPKKDKKKDKGFLKKK
ncbi:Mitosis inhibitor nif1 [Yarrowia sp. B02]|nr:Mitosis inhibitor nif1 [Yarrowia sp. B02]